MKYSDKNPPIKCFMNQSNWIKGALKNGRPVGILWHDTAAGNPYISRYVQPDDNAANKDEMIALLGPNKYHNDWNHSDRDAGVNFFVGKLADDSVASVQVGPWTTHPWGCGGGTRGSCNGYVKGDITGNPSAFYGKMIYNETDNITWVKPFWIQFEICDDNYKNGKSTEGYFDQIYQEGCEVTAYLCRKYNIDPKGVVEYGGATVPTITCHRDSHKLKLGSDHSDVIKWFTLYNKTMDDVRNDVAKLIAEQEALEKKQAEEEAKKKAEEEAKKKAEEEAKKKAEEEAKKKLYHVRKTWEDETSEKYVGEDFEHAKFICEAFAKLEIKEYLSIFTWDGTCVYTQPKLIEYYVKSDSTILVEGPFESSTQAIIRAEELTLANNQIYCVYNDEGDCLHCAELSEVDEPIEEPVVEHPISEHTPDVGDGTLTPAQPSLNPVAELPVQPKPPVESDDGDNEEDDSKKHPILNLFKSILSVFKKIFKKGQD